MSIINNLNIHLNKEHKIIMTLTEQTTRQNGSISTIIESIDFGEIYSTKNISDRDRINVFITVNEYFKSIAEMDYTLTKKIFNYYYDFYNLVKSYKDYTDFKFIRESANNVALLYSPTDKKDDLVDIVTSISMVLPLFSLINNTIHITKETPVSSNEINDQILTTVKQTHLFKLVHKLDEVGFLLSRNLLNILGYENADLEEISNLITNILVNELPFMQISKNNPVENVSSYYLNLVSGRTYELAKQLEIKTKEETNMLVKERFDNLIEEVSSKYDGNEQVPTNIESKE